MYPLGSRCAQLLTSPSELTDTVAPKNGVFHLTSVVLFPKVSVKASKIENRLTEGLSESTYFIPSILLHLDPEVEHLNTLPCLSSFGAPT